MNLEEAKTEAKEKNDKFTEDTFCPLILDSCNEKCYNRITADIRTVTSAGVVITEDTELEYKTSENYCTNFQFNGEV